MIRIRAAALALRENRILLARHFKSERSTYLLPGGGARPGESLPDALRRELQEEAAVNCKIGDLRYVVETRALDRSRHLLQFVFGTSVEGEIGRSNDSRVAECAWHPLSDLRSLRLHPAIGARLADDIEKGSSALCYILAPWLV